MFFVVLPVSAQSFVVFRKTKANPGVPGANAFVPHVAVDTRQNGNFAGRDWKSLAAQFQVKRR